MRALFRKKKREQTKEQTQNLPEVYSEDERIELESYIEQAFGAFSEVFHEIYAPDIHVDIAVVSPTEEENYYKLITMGMGAHEMTVPEELELYQLERAEAVIFLPGDWKIRSDEEKWYWPIRWLRNVARIPVSCGMWLGLGHTIAAGMHGETLSENNRFEGVMLTNAFVHPGCQTKLELRNKKKVNFYQIIPVYGDEMKMIRERGWNEIMFELFQTDQNFPVVNENRPPVTGKRSV